MSVRMSLRIRHKTMSFESDHLRKNKFYYILVSFMKEKHQKKNFLKKFYFTLDL